MNIRGVAWELLNEVFVNGKYANLIMRRALRPFASRDKALISQIVYGTIKNYRLLFYQFEDLWHKEPELRLKVLLAMSAYQLFFLDRVPGTSGYFQSHAKAVQIIYQSGNPYIFPVF